MTNSGFSSTTLTEIPASCNKQVKKLYLGLKSNHISAKAIESCFTVETVAGTEIDSLIGARGLAIA